MGHGTNDKLFVTPSEHSGVYGRHGASTGARKAEAAVVVPFDMCALTHEAWRVPACLPDEGLVYERANLERFLDKYHVSPASGRPASRDEVIALEMARNERGRLYDPVSCKDLTDHSHLVAIKPTGRVYLYDTVQQLNLKPKMLRDLVDDTPFTKADLLTIQDPHDPERRTMQKMYRAYYVGADQRRAKQADARHHRACRRGAHVDREHTRAPVAGAAACGSGRCEGGGAGGERGVERLRSACAAAQQPVDGPYGRLVYLVVAHPPHQDGADRGGRRGGDV